MLKTSEIIAPYAAELAVLDYKKYKNGDLNPDVYLDDIWGNKIETNWYGFSLDGIPMVWAYIIDKFLIQVAKETESDFKILQIKRKFGGLRFHIGYDVDKFPEIRNEIRELEKALFSKDLIY